MNAVTVWQPWASLIAIGAKRFETRGWATSYRGPIAIHAGAKRPFDTMDGADVKVIFAMGKAFGAAEKNIRVILDFLETLPRGAVIATAELVECWEITDIGHILDGSKSACVEGGWTAIDFGGKSNIIYGPEILFGDWREGRYAWELANVKPLAEPISVRGRQGLWDWEER